MTVSITSMCYVLMMMTVWSSFATRTLIDASSPSKSTDNQKYRLLADDANTNINDRHYSQGGGARTICAITSGVAWVANNGTLLVQQQAPSIGQTYTIPTDRQFVSVACSFDYFCGVDVLGRMSCFGDRATYLDMTPLATFVSVTMVTHLQSGHDISFSACGVQPLGDATCWGMLNKYGPAVPPTATTWRMLSHALTFVCGIKLNDNEIACFNATSDAAHIGWKVYADESTWLDLQCGDTHCCGLIASGHIRCFGVPAQGKASDQPEFYTAPYTGVPVNDTFRDIFVSDQLSCARPANGSNILICWGCTVHAYRQIVLSTGVPLPGLYDQYHIDANSIIDMICNAFQCFFITSESDHIQQYHDYPNAVHNFTIDYYDRVITGGHSSGPICAILNDTHHAHCMNIESSTNVIWSNWPHQLIRTLALRTLSYYTDHMCMLQMNGSVSCAGDMTNPDIRSWLIRSPSPSQTFVDLCVLKTCACLIRTNGTLFCWGTTDPDCGDDVQVSDYTDFTSLACNDYATCALRANGMTICWGEPTHVPIPPASGPWQSISTYIYTDLDTGVAQSYGHFYGVLNNGSLYRWRPPIQTETIFVEVYNMSRSDYRRVWRADQMYCALYHDHTLTCTNVIHVPDAMRLGVFDTLSNASLSTSSSLSVATTNRGGLCVVIEGQVTCTGDTKRFRVGGTAMRARNGRRIIQIAPELNGGSDTPFCGQPYFKPCASIQYAMTLLESIGPFVTFVVAPGIYQLSTPITIVDTGITIRGLSRNITSSSTSINNNSSATFICDQCFIINAPSFRLIDLTLTVDPTITAISINAFDTILLNCVFNVQRSSFMDRVMMISIGRGSRVDIVNTVFNCDANSAISMASAQLTITNSTFRNCTSLVGSGGALSATSSLVTITNSQFLANHAIGGGAIYMTQSELMISDSLFDHCFSSSNGGSLLLTVMRVVTIVQCVFTNSATTAATSASGQTLPSSPIGNGGAIQVVDSQGVSIIECQFLFSKASGDGVAISSDTSAVIVMDTIFESSSCSGSTYDCRGGSIGCTNTNGDGHSTPFTVLGGRSASHNVQHGGVFFIRRECAFTMERHIASSNYAYYGGVGVGVSQSSKPGVIINSTFRSNSAYFGGVYAGMDAALKFLNCYFEDNSALLLGAVLVTDGFIQDEAWPRADLTDGNIHVNNVSPFGCDEMVVSPPISMALHGNASTIPQASDVVVQPAIRAQLFDYFGHLVTIPLDYMSYFGPAVIRPYTDGHSPPLRPTSDPSGILEVTMSGGPEANHSFIFSAVTLTAPPGHSYTYTVALQRAWPVPFFDRVTTVDVRLDFNIELRSCQAGEYTSHACLPCPPGSFSRTTQATACSACASGQYQLYPSSSFCHDCTIGAHQPSTGATVCVACSTGSYTITNGTMNCVACTQSGLTCTNGDVSVDRGYWAWRTFRRDDTTTTGGGNQSTIELATSVCGARCEGGDITSVGYKPCSADRDQSATNILCGRCREGFMEFGASCIECRKPYPERILLAIVTVFLLVMIMHLFAQAASGLSAIFFYFVQMSLMMLPPTSVWLSWMGILSGGGATALGFCITPFTQGEQLALSVLSLPLLWTALLVIYLCQMALSRCGPTCGVIAPCSSWVQRSCYAPARYWRSVIGLYLFNYSSISNTLVGYLICVDVGNGSLDESTMMMDRVIYVSPTISCHSDEYKAWLPAVILLLIVVVIIPPIVFVVYLTRHRHQFSNTVLVNRIGNLYESYQPKAYWWTSMVLLRRVIFTLVDILLVVLPSTKFMLMGLLHLLSLVVHVIMKPYTRAHFNDIELVTLLLLTSLSLMMTAFPDQRTLRDSPSILILATVVVVIPVIGFMVYGTRQIMMDAHRCWYKRVRVISSRRSSSNVIYHHNNNNNGENAPHSVLAPVENDDYDYSLSDKHDRPSHYHNSVNYTIIHDVVNEIDAGEQKATAVTVDSAT